MGIILFECYFASWVHSLKKILKCIISWKHESCFNSWTYEIVLAQSVKYIVLPESSRSNVVSFCPKLFKHMLGNKLFLFMRNLPLKCIYECKHVMYLFYGKYWACKRLFVYFPQHPPKNAERRKTHKYFNINIWWSYEKWKKGISNKDWFLTS